MPYNGYPHPLQDLLRDSTAVPIYPTDLSKDTISLINSKSKSVPARKVSVPYRPSSATSQCSELHRLGKMRIPPSSDRIRDLQIYLLCYQNQYVYSATDFTPSAACLELAISNRPSVHIL